MKRFLRSYTLFSIALIAAVIAAVLDLSNRDAAAHWILGIISLIAAIPLLWDMIQDFRSGKYGIDILAATAIIASVLLHQYWAAIIVVIMLTGGEALENYAERRAHSELTALLARAPQVAHVLKTHNKVVDSKVEQVQIGDKLLIKAGEVVPVDAVLLDGSGDFDESSLTGESLPQAKQIGDQILSGSVLMNASVTVRAIHSAADSQYSQIIKLVTAASKAQAPFVRLADRYSIPFTFIAYVIAGTVWAMSGQAIRFLEVIVVATPCPLLLAAPIALMGGMSRASKQGIIIKTGSALEKLAALKAIAFDKTGTLTSGNFRVDTITTFGKHTKSEVLQLAASLEQSSTHILAKAIINAAEQRKVKLLKMKHVTEHAGHGLEAGIKGQTILVGRYSFVASRGITMPPAFKVASIKQTATFVAIGDSLAGIITFSDEVRPESKQTLEGLQALGITHTTMVTGDHKVVAAKVAKQLGMSSFHADALPGDKLRALERIEHRPVAFVGDGINDAPVLTAADVGIALGARGNTAASESADVVILPDNLTLVPRAIQIARRSFKIARQSIVVGIALSIALMIVFASGRFKPVIGAVIQEFVDVLVIINALRAHSDDA